MKEAGRPPAHPSTLLHVLNTADRNTSHAHRYFHHLLLLIPLTDQKPQDSSSSLPSASQHARHTGWARTSTDPTQRMEITVRTAPCSSGCFQLPVPQPLGVMNPTRHRPASGDGGRREPCDGPAAEQQIPATAPPAARTDVSPTPSQRAAPRPHPANGALTAGPAPHSPPRTRCRPRHRARTHAHTAGPAHTHCTRRTCTHRARPAHTHYRPRRSGRFSLEPKF